MHENQVAELHGYIDILVEGTRAGKFVWMQANPTTYTWQTPGGRLVLQRVESMWTPPAEGLLAEALKATGSLGQRRVFHYMLQGEDPKQLGQVLSLNGRDSPEMNKRLKSLYESISEAHAQRGLNFLKGLVGGDGT